MVCRNEKRSYLIVGILFMLFAIPTIETFSILAEIPPPPSRPHRFQSREELKRYLQRVHEYYAIVGRPRFGRSLATEQYHPNDRTLFQYLKPDSDNSIAWDAIEERLKTK